MERSELYDRIIESYEETNSVKRTTEELGTSVIKVRRVLITEGLWSSPTSRKIGELIEQGMSTKEIADKLNYTEKNVQAFSPYTKGEYGRSNRSDDSLRAQNYRARNQYVAENLIGAGTETAKDYIRTEESNEGMGPNYGNRPIALKLHLELDMDSCDERDMKILRKHGKVNKGISRDIIVPADITLHALHYAIQKLFGWQNTHLHHYEFPEEIFDELTEGSFARWCSLAGIYFRIPEDDLDDLFWDDDYEPNISVKSWLKSKYTGPYFYGGLGDYYYENQRKIQELKKTVPAFAVLPSFQEFVANGGKYDSKVTQVVSLENATIEQVRNSIDLGGDFTHLIERLTLMEYLYLPNNNYFLDSIDDKIAFYEDGLESAIENWVAILGDIDNRYDEFCAYAALSTVRMQAKSDLLNYFYDYGDGWKVSIRLAEAYYMDSIDYQQENVVSKVCRSYTPVCVEADGLPVFDDVGGIYGYIDFLMAVHYSENEEERAEIRDWARSLGWTGRASKPGNLL